MCDRWGSPGSCRMPSCAEPFPCSALRGMHAKNENTCSRRLHDCSDVMLFFVVHMNILIVIVMTIVS